MKQLIFFAAMWVALFATSIVSAQLDSPSGQPTTTIYSHENPLVPDLVVGDDYVQSNPAARALACIVRDDYLDAPHIVYENYDDFLDSNQTELANYDTLFPNGVHGVYVAPDGNSCTYTYNPASGGVDITYQEAGVLLFEMGDFWGGLNFVFQPTTKLVVASSVDETRILIGYRYIICCPTNVKYVGITKDLNTRFTESGHDQWPMVSDPLCTVSIAPVYSEVPWIPFDTETKNILQAIETCEVIRLYVDDNLTVLTNNEGVLMTTDKADEYKDYYKPTLGKDREMKFKVKGKSAKPIYCDPDLKKNEQLPGYTPPSK